jgi:hypothetical protein
VVRTEVVPVRRERTVMDEKANYGEDKDVGGNPGAFTTERSVDGLDENPAVMENIEGAPHVKQFGKENMTEAVKELNLKGKNHAFIENQMIHEVPHVEQNGKENIMEAVKMLNLKGKDHAFIENQKIPGGMDMHEKKRKEIQGGVEVGHGGGWTTPC